jgi:hypothetical protein
MVKFEKSAWATVVPLEQTTSKFAEVSEGAEISVFEPTGFPSNQAVIVLPLN